MILSWDFKNQPLFPIAVIFVTLRPVCSILTIYISGIYYTSNGSRSCGLQLPPFASTIVLSSN